MIRYFIILIAFASSYSLFAAVNVNPTTLNFGPVLVGSPQDINYDLSGSGMSQGVTITVTPPAGGYSISINGSGFTTTPQATSGASNGTNAFSQDHTITGVTVTVRFTPPGATGTAAGNVTNVASIALQGTANVAVTAIARAVEPGTVGSFGTLTGQGTSMTVNFTPGNGGNRMVVANQGSAPGFVPVDGTNYTANSNYTLAANQAGGGRVVYASNLPNNVVVSGLTPSTQYYFSLFEYNAGTVAEGTNYNPTPSSANASSGTVLGVTFQNFHTEYIAGNLHIRWRINCTDGNTFIDLEKSSDGLVFENLNHNSCNGPDLFDVIDPVPFYLNMYRLAFDEGNGNKVYSSTIVAKKDIKNTSLVYPTKFDNEIHIKLQENTHVTVYNAGGMLVLDQNFQSGHFMLNTNHWPSGVYAVHTGGTNPEVIRIIK